MQNVCLLNTGIKNIPNTFITASENFFISKSDCVCVKNNYILSFTIGASNNYQLSANTNILIGAAASVKPAYATHGIALIMSGGVVVGMGSIIVDTNGQILLNTPVSALYSVITGLVILDIKH